MSYMLDASEVFIDTPNDCNYSRSTWSNYKHHNTVKFLVGCTPNGAISFVSPLYVGSISDVELTRISGLVEQLKGMSNISVMADRGFTIRDQLSCNRSRSQHSTFYGRTSPVTCC